MPTFLLQKKSRSIVVDLAGEKIVKVIGDIIELVQRSMERNVYSYEPAYNHRRKDGEMLDEETGEIFDQMDSLFYHFDTSHMDTDNRYTYS